MTGGHTRGNLCDLLAVGLDAGRTRIVVDTAEADVVCPLAATVAGEVTRATVDATYGDPGNIGLSRRSGRASTLAPARRGTSSDARAHRSRPGPNVRVCCDLAAKQRYDVDRPGSPALELSPGSRGAPQDERRTQRARRDTDCGGSRNTPATEATAGLTGDRADTVPTSRG
jgi:tryptophanyl-tRNA synthetase